MFKIGDKVVIKKPEVYLFNYPSSDEYCEIGEVFTIDCTQLIVGRLDDEETGIYISNDRGHTWVYKDEIESLRKYKLKRVLCI